MVKTYQVTAKHYGGGLDMSSGSENLAPEQLTIAENVRFTGQGGVKTRNGFKYLGASGGGAKIDTIHTHEPYDVLFCKSGTGIYQSLDGITWYTVGATRTASARDFFYSYGNDVFVTNPTDGLLRIAVSTLATAITGASTEIVVRAGDGTSFDSSGAKKIRIQGDDIDYNGISTDTLGSVTNIGASHAAGTIITQTVALSSAPKGSWLVDLMDSLVTGGVSANKNVVSYSAVSTEANPEFAYDFSGNGAGSKLLPTDTVAGGKVTGGILIGLKKGIHYGDSFELDTGALITRPLSDVHGVNNAFAFAQGDKRTYALTNTKRIIPIITDAEGVRIIDDTVNDRNNLDYPIRSFLNDIDEDQSMSFSHYDPVTAEAIFTVLKDGISHELVFNEDLGKWSIDIGKPFSCRTNFKKRVYAGSDNADKVYLDNDGTRDDTIPILHRIVTGSYTVDDKRISSEYLKFTFGGLLSGAGSFTFRIYINGSLQETVPVTAEMLQDRGLMSTATGRPLGSGVVGPETIGSSGSIAEAYPFTLPYECLLSGETFQAEWEIYDEGTSFELRDSRLDAEMSQELYLNSF